MSAIEVTENQAHTNAEGELMLDDDCVDQKTEALACLVEGKRIMLCRDIPAAVSCLAEACELMSAECGDKAPECGEAYYFYGKALLELARLENVVLGNALSGVPSGEDCGKGSTQVEDPEHMTEEERTEVEEKVNEALVENFENCEISESPLLMKAVANTDGGEKAEAVEKVMDVDDPEGDCEDEHESDEECEDIDEEKDEAKADEDPTNLQLAWEVLELSKIICKEQLDGGKDLPTETKAAMEKRYCDTYLLLSEVSVESGNYHQAVEDLKVCLERQKTLLPADSRNIAETFYHLGVALGFHKNYDEALMSLDAAITVLNNRMTNLKDTTGSESRKETSEIEALLPEVNAKIVDLKDMKAETSRKAVELYAFSGKSVDSSKPVCSIPVKVDFAK